MKKISAAHKTIMKNPDSLFNYFAWPSVGKLPDGTLAAVASGYRLGHVCPFGKSVISYSRDNGETWTRPAPVIDTPLDDRDSGITCIGGNRVMITSFNNTTAMQRGRAERSVNVFNATATDKYSKALKLAYCDLIDSTDLQEKYIGSTYVISEDGGYTFGEVRRIPVTNIHGPCVAPNGDVLYIGRRFDTNDGERNEDGIECWKMRPDYSFEYVSSIENVKVDDNLGEVISCEPCSTVLPDGKIIVMIRVQRSGDDRIFTTYQSESTDGGKTFSKPVNTGNNGAPCHIMRHSSGVLIATYGYRTAPYGQRVMFSHDDGKTWDMDYILRDDGQNGDLGYPCTVELDDGSLLTVYYQAEAGTKNTVIMQSKWSLDGLFE